MAGLQHVRGLRDVGEHVERSASDVRRHGQSGQDATLQPGDPHHEELIQVAGEDGEEVRPLEHGQIRVLRQLEHALVESEPAQLAVEVPVIRQGRVVAGNEGIEVVVEVAGKIGARLDVIAVHLSIFAPEIDWRRRSL